MPICQKCNNQFPNRCIIDGKERNLHKRKFCVICSPFGKHNTVNLCETNRKPDDLHRQCSKCKLTKNINEFFVKRTDVTSWCKNCLYTTQKQRWVDRKLKAIALFGSKCNICGYDKNYAALDFHHLDQSTKEFDWSQLKLSKWENIVKELKKCTLLCRNCHAELHFPHATMDQYKGTDNNLLNKTHILQSLTSTGNCLQCGVEVYGTQYCSTKCVRFNSRRAVRPPYNELMELVNTNGYSQVGRMFKVSDNSIRKWAKRYEVEQKCQKNVNT